MCYFLTNMNQVYTDVLNVLQTEKFGPEILSLPLIPSSSENINVSNILEHPGETSISAKLASDLYTPPTFYTDLKLAFARLISGFSQNSEDYNHLNTLFKSIADLFLREVARLQLSQPAVDNEQQARVFKDFIAISTELNEFNKETFWITAANGPLFMSLSNKAAIDPRETAVAGSVHTVNLMPYTSNTSEHTLGFTSPLQQRIPQPNLTPTNMLSTFVHPNSHSSVTPTWISGQNFSSFAPSLDSSGAVVDSKDAEAVYIEYLNAYERAQVQKDSQHAQQAQPQQAQQQPQQQETHEINIKPNFEPLNLTDEDIQLLMRWSPYSFIDDDEIEAVKTNKQHELVSKTLLDLQTLQNSRLTAPGTDLEITDFERHLALKSSNILRRLVEHVDRENYALKLDTRLPVLLTNYSGTLPAATDPAIQPQPQALQNRLQSLASLRTRGRPSKKSLS